MLRATARFPVRPIQRQSVRPGNAKQLHNKQREFGIRHLEFSQKALEPFVVRFLFGMAGKSGGQDRKIDSPHFLPCRETRYLIVSNGHSTSLAYFADQARARKAS